MPKTTKKIRGEKEVNNHTLICDICRQMAKRGYTSEAKYWDDFFCDKLKPIKYKLIKTTTQK